jgi:hypothetical protein
MIARIDWLKAACWLLLAVYCIAFWAYLLIVTVALLGGR